MHSQHGVGTIIPHWDSSPRIQTSFSPIGYLISHITSPLWAMASLSIRNGIVVPIISQASSGFETLGSRLQGTIGNPFTTEK